MDKEDSMGVEEAEKTLTEELKKPWKSVDRALVLRAQRVTFSNRRVFISNDHDGKIGSLIQKYSFLGIAEFIEKEVLLLKPSLGKADENWGSVYDRLKEILGLSNSGEDEVKVFSLVQERIKFNFKSKSSKQMLISECKTNNLTLKTKDDDPPRLVVVKDESNCVTNCFIVGGGVKVAAATDVKKALTQLLYCYYAWYLTYPKYFQLLGFVQYYVLGDKDNKFSMSANFLKFTKDYEI